MPIHKHFTQSKKQTIASTLFSEQSQPTIISQGSVEFFINSEVFRSLSNETLLLPNLNNNSIFKIRFYIAAQTSYLPEPAQWLIDDINISGSESQPFYAVGGQQITL